MMSFGFSAGDFVAAVKIIADLITCLKDVGGSRDDYQELIRELESLDRTLKHIDTISDPRANRVKCAALMCRHPLEEYLQKVQKYSRSLGLSHTANKAIGYTRSAQWMLTEKNEARRLRTYLSLHIGSIDMSLATLGLEILQGVATTENQKDFNRRLENTSRAIGQLSTGVDSQAELVRGNRTILAKLFDVVRGDVVAPLKVLGDLVTTTW